MRICFVLLPIEHYSPVSGGAIATITFHVAQELEALGHAVHVLAVADGQPHYSAGTVGSIFGPPRNRWERICDWAQGRICRWEWHGYGRFQRDVRARLLALQPDVVVFANDLLAPEWGRAALPRARVGVWLHNVCRPRRSARRALDAADFFITCSEFLRGWYLREYPLDPGRIRTVLAGVDHAAFRPEKSRSWRDLRVLFVGRLDRNKGLDLALDAVGALHAGGIPIRLSVAGSVWFHGSGIFSPDYMERMRPALQRPGVDWLGHVPRRWLPQVMRGNDVCLVLSRSEEPFGLVVLEAMASGLAVVTSGRGGLPEAGAGAAAVVDSLSVEAVAGLLRTWAGDRAVLEGWMKKSRERAQSATWEKTANGFLQAATEESLGKMYETVGN